jgi:hypothetical protein
MDLDENNLLREGFEDFSRLLNARDKASYLIDLMHYIVRFLIPSLASLQDEYKGFCDLYHARFSQGPQVFSNEIHAAFNALPEKTIGTYFYGYFIIQDLDEDDQHDLNPEWKTFMNDALKDDYTPCIFCCNHVDIFDPAATTWRENFHHFHYFCYRTNLPSIQELSDNLSILLERGDSQVFMMTMTFMANDPAGIKKETQDMFVGCFSSIFDVHSKVDIPSEEDKKEIIDFKSGTLTQMIERDLSIEQCISRDYIGRMLIMYLHFLETPNLSPVIRNRLSRDRMKEKNDVIRLLVNAIWTQGSVYRLCHHANAHEDINMDM